MSLLIKKTHLAFNDPKTDFQVNNVPAPERQPLDKIEHTQGRKDLLNGKYNVSQEDTGYDSKIPK